MVFVLCLILVFWFLIQWERAVVIFVLWSKFWSYATVYIHNIKKIVLIRTWIDIKKKWSLNIFGLIIAPTPERKNLYEYIYMYIKKY